MNLAEIRIELHPSASNSHLRIEVLPTMTCHQCRRGQVLLTKELVNRKASSTCSRDQHQDTVKVWGQRTVCRPQLQVQIPLKTCRTEEPLIVDLNLPHSTILVPWRESTNSRLRVCSQLRLQTLGLAMLLTGTEAEWQVCYSADITMKSWAVKQP